MQCVMSIHPQTRYHMMPLDKCKNALYRTCIVPKRAFCKSAC